MPVALPELPYGKDALAPHISSRTLEIHHGKHHRAYVRNLNMLIEGTDLVDMTLEEIVKGSTDRIETATIFNNAAQAWNHSFYWHSMTPGGGGPPSGPVAARIDSDFGGYAEFIDEFKDAGLTEFGSGWAWLVLRNDGLEILKTSDADTPIAHGLKPLLTVDVWEHAYYLDHENRRNDYLDAFIGNLINWDFVNRNLA